MTTGNLNTRETFDHQKYYVHGNLQYFGYYLILIALLNMHILFVCLNNDPGVIIILRFNSMAKWTIAIIKHP